MQQHGSKILPIDPHSPTIMGAEKKVKIHLFQKMVMLHIKLKGYSVLAHTLNSWGVVKWSKHFFLKVVMLHVSIKLMGMANRSPCKHILCCPYTHPRPLGWGKKLKHFLLKEVMVAYQIKGNEQ